MAATAETEAEAAISAPEREQFSPQGRPDLGAARPRTEELYSSHGRMVAGLCRLLLRDRVEAEDAAQQVFLSAHRALRNGSEPREPAAWLATIARNECWARARSRMREPLAVQDVEVEGGLADPVEEAVRRADLAALWGAIAELPQQQRDALLLREFGGLSYEELAVALAVTGPAVESLLFRARQGLRARLKAVYAALTGASWLDAVVRLVGGGSAPVATKAVAVGLGAAALSGGAVVAPRAFEHPVRTRPAVLPDKPAARAPARTVPAPTDPAPTVSAVLLPVRHRARPAAAPVAFAVKPPPPASEHQRSGGDDGGEHMSGPAEAAGGGETEDNSGSTTPVLLPPTRTVSGSGDGGDGGSPQGNSGSSGRSDDGGSGREDGSSGDSQGSGGGGGGDNSSGSAPAPPGDGSDG